MPSLLLVLAGCLLGVVDFAVVWLPPVAPPPLYGWAPAVIPISTTWSGGGPTYTLTGSVRIDLRGRFYTTGADVTFLTLTVTQDGVPVKVDQTRSAIVANLVSGNWGTAAGGWGPLPTQVVPLVQRAAMTPGTTVSKIFEEEQLWERVWFARAAALLLLWAGLACSLVWLGVRAGRRVAAAREKWREQSDRCVRCGYALAGLVDGAPCPECGMPAVRSRDPYVERLRKKVWRG